MAATATVPPLLSPGRTGTRGADREESNASSPLSEVDDTDTKDGDGDHMQLDADDIDNSSLPGESNQGNHEDGSDSESALSEANSDLNSEVNDTEAETERLYDTPKNPRQRDVIVDRFNHGQVFETTPSKLRNTAAVDDEAENEDGVLESDDDSSAASDHSPTKAAKTQITGGGELSKQDSQERKRKRSPANETSESDQPLRKRTASVVAQDEDVDDENVVHDDGSANAQSANHSGDEESDASPRKRSSAEDELPERRTRSAKIITRNGLKLKGSVVSPVEDEPEDLVKEETAEEETGQDEADPEVDGEEEADLAAKTAEESKNCFVCNNF